MLFIPLPVTTLNQSVEDFNRNPLNIHVLFAQPAKGHTVVRSGPEAERLNQRENECGLLAR